MKNTIYISLLFLLSVTFSSAEEGNAQPQKRKAPRTVDRAEEQNRNEARKQKQDRINKEYQAENGGVSQSELMWYEEAEIWLKELANSENPPHFINRRIATVLLKNPDKLDEAKEWIDKALAEHDPEAPQLLKVLETVRKESGIYESGLLTKKPGVAPGYTLLATMGCDVTYLIDNDGNIIHEWKHDRKTVMAAYLLPDGSLLHTVRPALNTARSNGQQSGVIVEKLSWEGERLWEYKTDQSKKLIHHDIEPLPNGNVMMIVWEKMRGNEYAAVGRDLDTVKDETLLVDAVYEVKPTGTSGGEVVWRWSPWDHLIQNRNRELPNFGLPSGSPTRINVNYVRSKERTTSDWLHINSVNYNADRDEVMICSHALGEIWIISRKTNELVYRWGNPHAYGKGTRADRALFNHHDAHWIPKGYRGAGNILVFNNGINRPSGEYSSVLELVPVLDAEGQWILGDDHRFLPPSLAWEYTASPKKTLFSRVVSGSQRLQNGNTLICAGVGGRLIEVNEADEVVWEYINPVKRDPLPDRAPHRNARVSGSRNMLFRAHKYAPDYDAFSNRTFYSKGKLK